MTHRFSVLVGVAALGAAVLLAPCVGAEQGPAATGGAGEVVKWQLERLSQEPLKLIKATPDPQRGQVRFVVEFTRPPAVTELFDWEQSGGPVVFRFLDEDGVVLRTVKPRLEGEIIAKTGSRIRFVLSMPDERTLALTRSVVAH